MRIGAFQIDEPLPELQEPHAFCVLRPWVDVGNTGSAATGLLEDHFNARLLGKLARPGNFFDFTRYRPSVRFSDGQRRLTIPNSIINYAHTGGPHDLIFLHLLEPHMFGDIYTSSVLTLLRKFNVRRYYLIGGMYDAVPHTRPLIVSGMASNGLETVISRLGVQTSDYEGPTTITMLVSQEAPEYGIETMSLIVHLPHYSQIEDDYAGQLRLLEVLSEIYGLSLNVEALRRKTEKQYKKLNNALQREPDGQQVLQQFEDYYDARLADREKTEDVPHLSPEIETFLKDIGRNLDSE